MLLSLLLAALAPAPRPVDSLPRLVVLIVADQFRADYLDRFGPELHGGLGRLVTGGLVYHHARQAHAITETAPGHATLLSGRYPSHTGIVSNTLGVADADAPLLGSSEPGASPRRFRGTTLADWMLAADSATRVLSVSRKDRGAILTVGRGRLPVYWWTARGFTTSTYYAQALPDWVRNFNARGAGDSLAGHSWETDSAVSYPEPDSLWFENGGTDRVFPHKYPTNPDSMMAHMKDYPVMDSLTLAFALQGAATLGLGGRDHPDLLVISLSTTDAVGHAFGPDSRELHDQVLRLDRWLGQFLDSLATLVPPGRTLVAFSSDHGVQSFPEYTAAKLHRPAGRLSFGGVARAGNARLLSRHQFDPGLNFDTGLLAGDVAALRARGVNVDSLAESLAADMRGIAGVRRVYTPRTLAAAPATDPDAVAWRLQLPADFGWLVCATLEPGYVWSSGRQAAEHGSTTTLDQEVPLILWGAGIPARSVMRKVPTVDLAPTLARLLHVRPTERLDGVPLGEVLARP